ncbi:uncharacterized protein DS421_15g497310 [Arachis hypogaea]|nr:uncharacterized protein DS421_15g497310 [Arachis hypogaea]
MEDQRSSLRLRRRRMLILIRAMHCFEMENQLEKEKGVSESLRDRNMQLEFEKSELLGEKKKWDDQRCVVDDLKNRNIELEDEKCGLLEEKKKRDDAKGGIDGVSRLERETTEDEKQISLDDDGSGGIVGDDGNGSNSEENKTGVEKDALERNENVGLSSRDSATLIIPSKDGAGVTAASGHDCDLFCKK